MSIIDAPDNQGSILNHVVGSVMHLHKADASLHRVYVIPTGGDYRAPALSITSVTPLEVKNVMALQAAVDDTSNEWHGQTFDAGVHPDNDEVRNLFHSCWGKASMSPEYNKSDWNALAMVLKRSGYEV
jgi:hypothetical protein